MGEVFSDRSDEADRAIAKLASRFQCDERVIDAAMSGLMYPGWLTPETFTEATDAIYSYNRAANLASELAKSMKTMSVDDLQDLRIAGAITREQVEHLARVLYQDSAYFESFKKNNPRQGGKRLDAFNVAKIVHRIFRILGKPTRVNHVSGHPVSEYAVAVEYAMAAFNIKADWRRAAVAVAVAVAEEYMRRQCNFANAVAAIHADANKPT